MVRQRSITLIAPSIAPAAARAEGVESGAWPGLARLAGRGKVECCGAGDVALEPWQIELLRILDLDEGAQRYPDAAVRRASEAVERPSGCWLRATPLHLAAGLDHLTAVNLSGAFAVDQTERERLAASLAPHLQDEGFELTTTSRGEWLLQSARPLNANTATPAAAASTALEDALPQGPDGRILRRVMTELQMLLHEHPVNLERDARGAPPINAVWLHGLGSLEHTAQRALPAAFGGDSYLRGLYRLHDQRLISDSAEPDVVLAHARDGVVALIPAQDLDEIERRWARSLWRALSTGAANRIEIVLDRWRITATRAAVLRFWRRAKPPSQWSAACQDA